MGAVQGTLDTNTREAYGTPAPPSPDLPIPKRQCFCRWAAPAQGAETSVTCSPFPSPECHPPSWPCGWDPPAWLLPAIPWGRTEEGGAQKQGTHWTRPTGAPGPHWTTLVPGEVAVPPTSFPSHTGHRQLRIRGMRWTRKPSPCIGPQPTPDTLDPGATPAAILSHTPLLARLAAARASQSLYVSVE